MPERKLSKNVPLPLSHQLLEILRDLILKGNYKAGQLFLLKKKLPRNTVLAEQRLEKLPLVWFTRVF